MTEKIEITIRRLVSSSPTARRYDPTYGVEKIAGAVTVSYLGATKALQQVRVGEEISEAVAKELAEENLIITLGDGV